MDHDQNFLMIQSMVDTLSNKNRILEEDLGRKAKEHSELLTEYERLMQTLSKDRENYVERIYKLQTNNDKITELYNMSKPRILELEEKLQEKILSLNESNSKCKILEDKLNMLSNSIELEKKIQNKVTEAFENSFQEKEEKINQIVRQNEEFKKNVNDANHRASLLSQNIDAYNENQAGYIQTIQALQSLLKEKMALIEALRIDLREEISKNKEYFSDLEEHKKTITVLNDIIKKNHEGNLKFMQDIASKDQEIDSLRSMCIESRINYKNSSNIREKIIDANRSPFYLKKSTLPCSFNTVKFHSPNLKQPQISPYQVVTTKEHLRF